MPSKLPPAPVGVPASHSFWNDWYEKIRNIVNSPVSVLWSNVDFTGSNLTSISTRNHNDLQTIQGGSVGEYYHLSAANNTALSGARTLKGVDTTDDLIVDTTTKGLVLKSPNGHYWRASISNAGVVTWTDLGTTKP